MAASAAAAAGSSFSPSSIHTFKRMHIKHCPLGHSLLKVSPARIMLASLYRSDYVIEPLSQVAVSWRVPRVSASVAQEEAPATASAVEEEELASEEAKGETNEIPVNTKLYFGNLPYNVDSAQLAGIIQEYGSPEMVEVLYHRETGRSRGFAFVTMSSIEDCNAVIENLDESHYMGRILRVNFSDNPKPKEPLYPETEYKLFVGNLSWSATSESLTQAFQEYGNVVGARVLYDGETGKSRGYGFVCYSTKAEMQTALVSLDGVELEGRALRVSLAEGRKS
ncbi:28 kDa ribonucleoprotein, chloroplastic-like [Populus nigra]|uniref:28 kDa ribonucleoprotein, chloroplastic-like n=1 Tax=Populus nigra TaxID=3691 RepID=UPI002B2793A8|nr:28 kDa ribonucleoprotein, chloroplastic-like [Populus nigra]